MYSLMNHRIISIILLSLLNFSCEQLHVSLDSVNVSILQIEYAPTLIFHHPLNNLLQQILKRFCSQGPVRWI